MGLINHLSFLKPGDISLFDRNHGAFWLFALQKSKVIHFCAKLKTGTWKVTKQLVDSGQREIISAL